MAIAAGAALEVRWEVRDRPFWWPALVHGASDDGGLELLYVAHAGMPAHLSAVRLCNDRELWDAETQSLLRWRRARKTPTFSPADLAALEMGDSDTQQDAAAQLRVLSAADKQRFHAGMAHLHAGIREHLATLPAGHTVTPADIRAAVAQASTPPNPEA